MMLWEYSADFVYNESFCMVTADLRSFAAVLEIAFAIYEALQINIMLINSELTKNTNIHIPDVKKTMSTDKYSLIH